MKRVIAMNTSCGTWIHL